MRVPEKYSPETIKGWSVQVGINGMWVPARPLGFQGFFLWTRIKRAWLVFTGKADVLVWTGGCDDNA
jgi:hypothetical protein